MAVITVKPTVTAELYTTRDQVGQLMELKLREIYSVCRCLLESITITDLAGNGTVDYVFLFFNRKPTNGTYADGAALDVHDDDMPYCIGMVYVDGGQTAPPISFVFTDNSVMTRSAIGLPLEASAIGVADSKPEEQNIWCLVATFGAPTYASVADVTFKFGFRRGD